MPKASSAMRTDSEPRELLPARQDQHRHLLPSLPYLWRLVGRSGGRLNDRPAGERGLALWVNGTGPRFRRPYASPAVQQALVVLAGALARPVELVVAAGEEDEGTRRPARRPTQAQDAADEDRVVAAVVEGVAL